MTALVGQLANAGNLAPDPRDLDNKVYVNGRIVHRDDAVVPVYDSGFMLGDGVWEGIRLHKGAFLFLEDHLKRLFAGAKCIGMNLTWGPDHFSSALQQVARENGMNHNVHMRLILSRGTRIICDQDPRLCTQGPTLVIIPEHKDEKTEDEIVPLNLMSVHQRRGLPDTQDPKLNSLSKLNCILAFLSVMHSEADEALMMDVNGFVNTCNSVNFFILRDGEVWTSTADYCMNGITRAKTIEACSRLGITCRQRNYSLFETYSADAAFVTGTTGGQVPVASIDNRRIGNGGVHPEIARIRAEYKRMCAEYAVENRFTEALEACGNE